MLLAIQVIVDFAVPEGQRIKIKENEKSDKYLEFTKEIRKLWNIKATVTPIIVCTFGTIRKGLV